MVDVRGWFFLALGLVVLGCNYDATGQGGGSGSDGGSTGKVDGDASASTTGEGVGSSTGVVLDDSGSSGSGSSGGSSSSEGSSGTTGEPVEGPRSCAEILLEDPSAETGEHTIVRQRDGARITVWCEMAVDDGGWTLVARSASGGSPGAFGWGVARGTVGEESQPYSLDAMDLELPFTEVLIGRRREFATLEQNAYVIEVPEGFLDDYRLQAFPTEGVRTVLGNCDPQGGPEMMRWLGHTEDEQNYFFRDFPENHEWGLFSNRLRTLYEDCENGGELHDEQGAMFVR